ncbi:extracellular catalytic domain type 1 short-chain-length polyhydroxyalkanoate depolymerase [Azospirillum thermophilum]|nr:PHB depolymerase family esterase [Azospirillum thermophilum]
MSTNKPPRRPAMPEEGWLAGTMAQAERALREAAAGHVPAGLRRLLSGLTGRLSGRTGQRPPEPPQEPDIIIGKSRFLTGRYANDAGSRRYRLYIPSRLPRGRVPLVVMLHGCKQSPEDFAAGTRMNELAEEQGFLVAYPAQSRMANAYKCWNWFQPDSQRRGEGEAALIAGITRQIIREHPVDPARVYIAGLSAGGAAASIMAATYPDLYAAAGVHSGLACGAAQDASSAFEVMRSGSGLDWRRLMEEEAAAVARRRAVPTIVFHGDRDETVHPSNGDEVIARSTALSGPLREIVESGTSPGGEAYRRVVHLDPDGVPRFEQWTILGGGHAWSGGSPAGSYTDPAGPDASREMLRFFLRHRLPRDAMAA